MGNRSLRESGKEHQGEEGAVLDTGFVLSIKNVGGRFKREGVICISMADSC